MGPFRFHSGPLILKQPKRGLRPDGGRRDPGPLLGLLPESGRRPRAAACRPLSGRRWCPRPHRPHALRRLQEGIHRVETELLSAAGAERERLLRRLGDLQTEFEHGGGYTIRNVEHQGHVVLLHELHALGVTWEKNSLIFTNRKKRTVYVEQH